MRKNHTNRKYQKKAKSNTQLRMALTRMAAKIMYEEGVGQYYDAKRIAAKRLLKQGGSSGFWIKDLPSNGEIAQALMLLADLYEGDARIQQFFAMRVIALDVMEKLSPFNPRLIGSVSTGNVRENSDIDIHVFSDAIENLEHHLCNLDWQYRTDQVSIQKLGKFMEFTHIYMHYHFPIELSVYPLKDLRVQSRSSTDGKPIVRLRQHGLQALIAEDHENYWLQYLETGEISGLPCNNSKNGN